METTTFQGKTLSRLGFGGMRFPLLEDGKTVDEERLAEMVDWAMAHGVNYFDTAYTYHDGRSEVVLGRVLARHPRESYYLATKYPGHQPQESYDPAATFEEQLHNCGVEYFDFYLLHNVNESTIGTYTDPRWGIVEYFVEQKRLGRIGHLGFSCHGSADIIRRFLDHCDGAMEFCQIQLNYLDWTLQKARDKYALLEERGVPVFVMEPVRGGRLAKLEASWEQKMKDLRPEESIPAWGFRYLRRLPGVAVILSGMSNLEQVQDNIRTFSGGAPLSEQEVKLLHEAAETMKDGVPCTACRYCCGDCPAGLDIPLLLSVYNDLRVSGEVVVAMRLEGLAPSAQPAACVGCDGCKQLCPQGIDVPAILAELDGMLKKIPKWVDICRERMEIIRRERQGG